MVDVDFLPIFLDEAAETLERWEAACLKLENSPDAAVLDELFRSAHNIKGSSRSVGLLQFGDLVHKAEDVITRLKSQELKPSPNVISVMLDCQKTLIDWVDCLRSDPSHLPSVMDIEKRLAEFQKNSSEKDTHSQGFAIFDEPVEDIAHESKPANLGEILMESGHVTQENLDASLTQQRRKRGEVLFENGAVSSEAVQQALESQRLSGQKPDETIRISLQKFDSVIRLVGELSIQLGIVRNAKEFGQLTESAALEAIDLAHKATADLQSEAMGLRMQPLESLFQRMERVCRDVARQQQKSLQVILKGTDVELDKTVIERMKDPLVHILRNAVDHGIEDTISRQKTNKSPTATVTIEGTQTAANVNIKISDDGRGLNEAKILQKAREKNLIPDGFKPSQAEIFNMIFMPGFSTAEKVTDVSGRGVGMDVVKRAVDDLGGTIHIESQINQGTHFLISLPSTLSIIDAVIIALDDRLYAVPIQDVEEVVDMSEAVIGSTTQCGRIINLRGRVFAVEKLADYLPSTKSDDRKKYGVALVSRYLTETVAFEIDRVTGQHTIVVRKLEGKLADVPGFTGATILPSGEPAMILHLQDLVKSFISSVKK